MAKTLLKVTPTHCAVKLFGAAGVTETVTLSTDLVIAPEVPASPTVNLKAIHFAVPVGVATIARNGVVLWSVTGCESLIFNGFYDTQNSGSDLVVTIPAGGGTVVLELVKKSGYGDEQHRNPLT